MYTQHACSLCRWQQKSVPISAVKRVSCFKLVVVLLYVKLTEYIISDTEHVFFLILLRSEEPYFDGTFIAKDTDVHHFVDEIGSKMKSVSKICSFFAPLI